MADDWWMRKLGGNNSPTSTANNSTAYAPSSAPSSPSWMTPTAPGTTAPPQEQQGERLTMENFGHALQFWKGGEGARNSAHCPECGSDKLFRRRVGTTEAAPLCYHCGYNGGMFRQGDPASWS